MSYKVYEMIINDDHGENVFMTRQCGKSKQSIKEECAGNGEIVRMQEVTTQYPIEGRRILHALEDARFSVIEINVILQIIRKEYAGFVE